MTIRDLFLRAEDFEHFRSVLTNGQIRDFEVELVSRKGVKKYCVMNCVFIPNQASDFCCYQGIIHDLTIRKKVEKDMLVAERLSLTGKIARTIAHEVRNPLTNLNLALGQLKEDMPESNESVDLFYDIMQRNVNRIEQLISEMLNSSRPKEFKLELTPLVTLVDEALLLAADRIKLKGIELIRSFSENVPRVLVDKEKMKIALLNIIVNAVEAMTPSTGVLSLSTTLKENTATIAIADNGKGIPADELEKLYDPFFTGKSGGMGLGLTSTKNIIDSHTAEIEVVSEVNKGTTFFIHFKIAS
jgi:signal transduction histidine kinase